MYFINIDPTIHECGECGSRNIARKLPTPYIIQGLLVCLDCGHEEKPVEYVADTNTYTFPASPTVRKF